MERSRIHTVLGAAAAVLSLTLVTGCSGIPGVPTEVNDAIQSVVRDFTDPVSVDEARAQRRDELVPAVSDADLNTPGTLTVGVQTAGTAPLVIAGDGDSHMGIDIDTAYALADELGLGSVEFVTIQNVASGVASCDIVMGVESTETNCAVVGSYAQSALGVFSSSEVASVPVAASELSGATVGVQDNSVSQAALEELGLGVSEQTFSNLNEAFDALSSGSVDYVVCDAYAGAYLACSYDSVFFAGTLDAPVPVGIGVSTDSTELQANVELALDEIQSNGVADIAKSRWVGEFPVLTEATTVTGLPEPQDQDADEQDGEAADEDGETTDEQDGEAADQTSADDAATDETEYL